jgi:glycosyltransferase involved in cell wall biosynthesis
MTRDLRRHIDPRKIVTIPNGVDTERVRSTLTSGEAKEKLGIERDCPVLGTAGRLEPIKRLDLFLRAAELISLEQPAARFVIAGDGSEEARLKNLARTLAIQDRVLFLGHRSDIADVLRALDVLVLCSDHEGLPMILLEALSLGVPVVARRVGGIPEVLEDGVNGVLVDSPHPAALAARCLEVLADESSRLRFAQAGVRLVLGNYAAAGTAAQVARLYRSLLQTE